MSKIGAMVLDQQEREDRDKDVEPMRTWSPPALTEQEQREHDEYIRANNCPF